MAPKKHQTMKALLVTFLACFTGLLFVCFIPQNQEDGHDTCQGHISTAWYGIGSCTTNYDEYTHKTGHGFPFYAVSIHSIVTVHGKTSTTYRAVDWYNLGRDLVFDTVVALVLTVPLFPLYGLARGFLVRRQPPRR